MIVARRKYSILTCSRVYCRSTKGFHIRRDKTGLMAKRPNQKETISIKTVVNPVYLWVKQKVGRGSPRPTQGNWLQQPTNKTIIYAGGDLLSHTLPSAVPSALVDLASGFGMGPGVTPPLTPPTKTRQQTIPTTFGWAVSCQTLNSRREQNSKIFHTNCVC